METIVLLQSLANPALDAVALALTNLGSENAYIVMLLVVHLAIDPRAGRILGIAVLCSFWLNGVLKEAIGTERPYVGDPTLLRSAAAGATAPGPAFPSGHAQLSTTFWGLVAVLARRTWIVVVAILAILAVSTSRVYLGVHWPIDVLGGLLVGVVVVAATVLAASARPRAPRAVAVAAWILVPLAVHLFWRTPDSGLVAGALAGFATGPILVRHVPPRDLGRRFLLALLGLVLVFAWLFGTSFAFADAVKDHVLVEPLRYFVLAWAGVVLAPLLGRRLGLAPREEAR